MTEEYTPIVLLRNCPCCGKEPKYSKYLEFWLDAPTYQIRCCGHVYESSEREDVLKRWNYYVFDMASSMGEKYSDTLKKLL